MPIRFGARSHVRAPARALRRSARLAPRVTHARASLCPSSHLCTMPCAPSAAAVTRTASCVLAWALATAFYSRHELAPDAGKAPEAQPSLLGALVAASSRY